MMAYENFRALLLLRTFNVIDTTNKHCSYSTHAGKSKCLIISVCDCKIMYK